MASERLLPWSRAAVERDALFCGSMGGCVYGKGAPEEKGPGEAGAKDDAMKELIARIGTRPGRRIRSSVAPRR